MREKQNDKYLEENSFFLSKKLNKQYNKGKPNPTIKWYKEGNEIEPNSSDDIIVSYDTNLGLAILVIKQVKPNDAGRYTCVARNALGSCSTSASVTVQGYSYF
jgi:hypothetical protein